MSPDRSSKGEQFLACHRRDTAALERAGAGGGRHPLSAAGAGAEKPRRGKNVREVYDGYIDALHDTGLRPSETLVAETSAFDIEAAAQALARVLEGPEPPTAVFAADETFALGVLQEAKARGLDVPRDLAIAGYAGSSTAALLDPPLTMVSVPAREIGFRAMETLSKLMRGKKPRPCRTILGTELVLRQSCGAH